MLITGNEPTTSMPSIGDGVVSELFKLLEEFCPANQLRNVVRAYRPSDKDFPVSVKREQLLKSLLKLFNLGHLPHQTLEELLARAEENGRQHLLFYVPATPAIHAKLNNFDAIQSGLLEGKTRETAGLPRFQLRPRNVEVADLRLEHRTGTQYTAWIYKLYAGAERWVQHNVEVKGDEKTVKFKLEYRRDVVVIKWHSFGLLELRIPTGTPKKQLESMRDGLLTTLSKVLAVAEAGDVEDENLKDGNGNGNGHDAAVLQPLRLATAAAKLNIEAKSQDREHRWVSVNAGEFDADGHSLQVDTKDDQEDIYDSPTLVNALKNIKDCKRLRVLVHLREHPDFPEKLAVELCGFFANEIRIGAQTTPEAVEFIVRRLWERAKTEPLPSSPVDAFAQGPENSELLRVDFDTFARHHPSLANAIMRIQQWVKEHPTAGFLEPDRLHRALGTGLRSVDIAIAVGKLVDEGILTRKYRIKPEHSRRFLSGEFDSLEELVAAEVEDEDGEKIDLTKAEIVAVFGKA